MNPEILKKLTILYVEDEIELRDATCKFLTLMVKKVVVADNGQEGLEKFKAGKFDLIITDLAMPKLSGTEMITEIRKIDPDIPIIITTAYGSQNVEISRLVEAGVVEHIMKPVDLMQLVKKIYELIGGK